MKIISIIDKKREPKSKLKTMLLRDEQTDYINSRYNKLLVERVTGLQGDSLLKFTNSHYPAYDWLKHISDYELIQYIKSKLPEK